MKGPIQKEIIERQIQELPLVDVAVFEVISMLDDPDANFEKIAGNLSPDVATRFLEMANSAYYGREVRSIGFAVRVLGFAQMKKILTSSILMSHFIKHIDFEGFNFEKFQRQARFCGAVSRVMGEILSYERPEDLFTVAILQNIGKLVLAIYFKEEFRQIIALKISEGIPTREAERRIVGTTHAEIGALVLKRFHIPEDICDAVMYHDTYERTVPEGPNYQLEFIAREATRIVGRFQLPEEMEPLEIVERLRGTVSEGRKKYRKIIEESMQEKGYRETFVDLLTQASDLVCRDLKVFLKERTGGEEAPENGKSQAVET
ncbi:MAG: HDOD domain-containing protein [Deltaproteobacteria bacterium]|nr:HDOD domain-containing protein [Deltaproteobacteria bacterium]